MQIPLEDTYVDVLGKAQRGLALPDSSLAEKLGWQEERLKSLKAKPLENDLKEVARVLELNPSALVDLALGRWKPETIELKGLSQFNTPFRDMTVNSYLVVDPMFRTALAFDTGTNLQFLLEQLKQQQLSLAAIFLTHTHGDHILELDLLKEKTGAPAYVGDLEPLEGAESFAAGKNFSFTGLEVETRLTNGHSKGGITYVVQGLSLPVAVVGDALFAGSMGGGGYSYTEALRTNRQQILSLSGETILCPGHGPLTTVANERVHNAFFKGIG